MYFMSDSLGASMNYKIYQAILVGIFPATLEAILLTLFDSNVVIWTFFQACFFWFSCGFVIHLVEIPNITSFLIKSIILSVFMNVPWFIALAIVPNQIKMLIPLIVSSIIQGILIGLISKFSNKLTLVNEDLNNGRIK